MSAPHNNNNIAVAPEPFYPTGLPRAQLTTRIILTLLAVAYAWRLPLALQPYPVQLLLAGAAIYLLAQLLLNIPGVARWGDRPALSWAMTGIDLLAGLSLLAGDPAPGAPGALLTIGILVLAASQHRWRDYLIFNLLFVGLMIALAAATPFSRQRLIHMPYDASPFIQLLFLVGSSALMLLLARQINSLRQRAARMTDTHPVTGLGNRWTLYEAARYLLPYHQRNHIPVVLMFADIDLLTESRGKRSRSTHEQVVRQFATISDQRLRHSDVAVHYGATSFAYLLADTTAKDAERIAADLQQAFEQWAGEQQLPAQAYVGVAAMPPDTVAIDQILGNISASLNRARHYKRSASAAVFASPEQQS